MALPTPGFRTGKDSRVTINGTIFRIKRANVEPFKMKHDVTNSESGGFGTYIGSIIDCDVSLEADYYYGDAAPPVTLFKLLDQTFETVSNVLIYLVKSGGVWTFPELFVERMPMVIGVRDSINIRVQGSGSGTFTAPAA